MGHSLRLTRSIHSETGAYTPVSFILLFSLCFFIIQSTAAIVFIPMDKTQKDHLRAYGVVYHAVRDGMKAEWALNYRGGSFIIFDDNATVKAQEFNITYSIISDSDYETIKTVVDGENMNLVPLEKSARIAVYAPPIFNPWDDAVTIALDYAKIPYDRIWDVDVINGKVFNYDWVHLHHEDFTGQFGKFLSYEDTAWYITQKQRETEEAKALGFKKVSEVKRKTAQTLRLFVEKGGFLFTMCSGTDTLDIALACALSDIVPEEYDGDPIDPDFASKMTFTDTFAFTNFTLITDPYVYEFSTIDTPRTNRPDFILQGYFKLFEFAAKIDTVPCLLNQNHEHVIKDFLGQTTAFTLETLKKDVTVLARYERWEEAKYIMAKRGKGFFVFFGGHDPEDFQHLIGDPPTDINLHRNSPGYRLILNNVLFPSAKKKELKT